MIFNSYSLWSFSQGAAGLAGTIETTGHIGAGSGVLNGSGGISNSGDGVSDELAGVGLATTLGAAGLSAHGLFNVDGPTDVEGSVSDSLPLLLVLGEGLGVSVLNLDGLLLNVGDSLPVDSLGGSGIATLALKVSLAGRVVTRELSSNQSVEVVGIGDVAGRSSNGRADVDNLPLKRITIVSSREYTVDIVKDST